MDDLPKGWVKSTLSEFTHIVMGQSPSSDTYNFDGQGLPFFQGKAEFTKLHPTVRKYCSSPVRIADAGATLLSVRAPVGPTNMSNYRCCVGRGLSAIHPICGVEPFFIFYFMRSMENYLSKEGTGSTFQAINKGFVESIELGVPPLTEQKRIVAKIEELLSELDKGVESLKTAQTQLKVYRQALLKHAFEGRLTADWREANKDKMESATYLLARIKKEREASYQQQLDDWKMAVRKWDANGKEDKKPAKPRQSQLVALDDEWACEMPQEWASSFLGSLNVKVFDGPFGSNLKTSDYVDEGVRVIRLENVGYLKFIENKHSYVTEEKYTHIKKHTVRQGDIIFSSFVIDGIRVVILPDTIDRAVNKADCFCIRLHGETVRSDYVALFLSSRIAYKQIEAEIHGVGRPRINTTQLKNFNIPLCSREEQDEIMLQLSEKNSVIDHLEVDIELQLKKTEALRQSILKRAFAGELVPQDPDAEPAAKLLERIKLEKVAQAKTKSSKRKKAS